MMMTMVATKAAPVAVTRARPSNRKPRLATRVQEGNARNQLHGEEPLVLPLDQLVEGDEIGVDDPGKGAELVLEAIEGGPTGP